MSKTKTNPKKGNLVKRSDLPATVAKTRYSEYELVEFKAVIEKKLLQVNDAITTSKNQLEDITIGNNSPDWVDNASLNTDQEVVKRFLEMQSKLQTAYQNALLRIKNGVYGVCRETGKLIPRERLLVVPQTTHSMEAKLSQQTEKKQRSRQQGNSAKQKQNVLA